MRDTEQRIGLADVVVAEAVVGQARAQRAIPGRRVLVDELVLPVDDGVVAAYLHVGAQNPFAFRRKLCGTGVDAGDSLRSARGRRPVVAEDVEGIDVPLVADDVFELAVGGVRGYGRDERGFRLEGGGRRVGTGERRGGTGAHRDADGRGRGELTSEDGHGSPGRASR